MKFDALIQSGKIRKVDSTEDEIKDIVALADRDIKMAKFMLSQNWDWAFNIAYNAVLQISRAYMYRQGYRPASSQGHKNIFAFMQVALKGRDKNMISYFDRMRVKRNKVVYDVAGLITETEVKQIIKNAKEIVKSLKKEI